MKTFPTAVRIGKYRFQNLYNIIINKYSKNSYRFSKYITAKLNLQFAA